MKRIQKKNQQHTSKKGGSLLFYLSILTLIFVLFEIGVVFQFSGFYLGDFKGISSNIDIPLKVYPPVLLFLLIQFCIHLIFILAVWLQTQFVGYTFNYSRKKIETLGIWFWVINILFFMFVNQYYYPNSKFSILMNIFSNQTIAEVVTFLALCFWFFVSIIFLLGIYKKFPLTSKVTLFFVSLLGIGLIFQSHKSVIVEDGSSTNQPNIIIIGLDAVRPDFLGYFGYEKITPHLDAFLNESTVFAESLTPLARTFPAWVSILTGKYPKFHGARSDLENPQNIVGIDSVLPQELRNHGYTTVFATDETRFSNIDQHFGFDQVITPLIGFNDFFLGSFNDFPLSNLIVNTWLGKRLFPYSYANRPAYSTYDPDSFLKLIKPVLEQPRTKPLFFAVHICLAHYPYFWGTQQFSKKSLANYQAALNRVDKQFNDLFFMIKKNNLLKHAIVIVMSDHGEALELHGDRATQADLFIPGKNNKKKTIPVFYPPNEEKEEVDQSAGHGTDVLGLSQYHNLLAFRLFGFKTNKPKIVAERVSLLDVRPTIMDFLGVAESNTDGSSLYPLIANLKTRQPPLKNFFIESDFSPPSVHTVHPETRDVVFEGVNYFHIDPVTLRLQVKDSMKKLILSSKQYADFYGDWVLALYPQDNKTMQPILVNLKNGKWTNDLQSTFALQSPANHMLAALNRFYGKDIQKIGA